MKKKLSASSLKLAAFADKVDKAIIKWVVENQSALAIMYKQGLQHNNNKIALSLDLRTKTGAKIGLIVSEDGAFKFRPYEPSPKAVKWNQLQAAGCPNYTK
jgi:hypothetical protein